jgi:hypothetical protein
VFSFSTVWELSLYEELVDKLPWLDELDFFHHDCDTGHTRKSIHLKAGTRRPQTEDI